jgi:hypothetical protein
MQLESRPHAQNPAEVPDGVKVEPAYITFVPDEGEYFLSETIVRKAITVEGGVTLDVPIADEDADPLREAKERKDNIEVLRIVRKYVQTKGMDFNVPDSHPLRGSVHEVPLGSRIKRGKSGRARFPVFGVVNELPRQD